MAEASPIDRAGRSRRGPRRRPPAEHIGDRCGMCRRKVTVDAQGRCPLGHQVVPAELVADRAEAPGEAREATIREAAEDRPLRRAGAAGGTDDASDPSATVVATYVEPAPGPADRSPAWSTDSPALDPAPQPLTIDLTAQPGAAQPAPYQSGSQAEPELPRRPSSAPATPPHGISAMLPVMGSEGAPAPEEVTDGLQPIPSSEEPSASVTGAPRVFEDPPPPLPLGDVEREAQGGQPPAPHQSLPHRTRTPMPPRARSLFTEALEEAEEESGEGDSDPVPPAADPPHRAQVRDAAVFARIVQPSPEESAGSGVQAGGARAAVPLSELTPDAPSALDLQDPPWTFAAASAAPPMADRRREPAEHEPAEHEPAAEEPELELDPPRGILQILAGIAFVAALLAIAWYLATSL